MRTTLAAAIATAMVLGTAAYAQTAEDAFGVWLNPENKSHTEFYKCGDGLCAKIVKAVDGQKTDDRNPDAARKTRPIVGLVIMQGAKKTGDNKWAGPSTTGRTVRAIREPSRSRARLPSICGVAWRPYSAKRRHSPA